MKIGIITQPLKNNYGGILQNYALQQVLIQLGHKPITIDVGKITWAKWMEICIKTRLKNFSAPLPMNPCKVKRREAPLRAFIKRHIELTRRYYRIEKKIIEENKLDALIVGSDQVWRPKYNSNIYDMFLNFARDSKIPKIAYAASFGTDDWEYSETQTKICSNLIQKFDMVSVRESSGLLLCSKYLNTNAVLVLDPTLLLDKDFYLRLIAEVPIPKTNYVFVYLLDISDEIISYVKEFAQTKCLDVIIKGADSHVSDEDRIEIWLSLINNADFVITDSFHGMVFSIIFNTPFVSLGNDGRGQTRFMSLLNLLGLESRIINDIKEINMDKISWESVNEKLLKMRESSMMFIRKAFES